MGASRRAIPNIYNGVPDNWGQMLYSCIATMKPFSVRVVHDSNATAWITSLQAAKGTFSITFPPEDAYTTGGAISFSGGYTDYTFGAADIENRVEGEFVITPTGKPTVTAGTVPT